MIYVVVERDYYGVGSRDFYESLLGATPEKERAEAYVKHLRKKARKAGEANWLLYSIVEVNNC